MRMLDWFPGLFLLWGMMIQSLLSFNSWFWISGVIGYLLLIIWYQKELDVLVSGGVE